MVYCNPYISNIAAAGILSHIFSRKLHRIFNPGVSFSQPAMLVDPGVDVWSIVFWPSEKHMLLKLDHPPLVGVKFHIQLSGQNVPTNSPPSPKPACFRDGYGWIS